MKTILKILTATLALGASAGSASAAGLTGTWSALNSGVTTTLYGIACPSSKCFVVETLRGYSKAQMGGSRGRDPKWDPISYIPFPP